MNFYDLMLAESLGGSGGGGNIESLVIGNNGTFTASGVDGYAPINVSIPVFLSYLSITANTGQNAYIDYPTTSTARGGGICLNGTHSLRKSSSSGSNSFFYPIPVPPNVVGVKITSNDLDCGCSEFTDATEWQRSTSSGWMLKSDSTEHTYMFTTNPTHITMAFRQAGYTTGGNVTQEMMSKISFEWITSAHL